MADLLEKIVEFVFWLIFTLLLYWTGFIALNIISIGFAGKYFNFLRERSLKWEVIESYTYTFFGFAFYLFAFSMGNKIYSRLVGQ